MDDMISIAGSGIQARGYHAIHLASLLGFFRCGSNYIVFGSESRAMLSILKEKIKNNLRRKVFAFKNFIF